MRPVLGAQNPRVAELRRLIGRRSSRSGDIVIEGPRTVGVLGNDHDRRLTSGIERRLPASVEFLLVRDHVFERLAPSTTPQPMLAIVARPVASLPAAPSVVLVLAGVSDPGNLGTLVRAADAVAADAVVVVGGADPWGPKAVRASAGSVLRVPIVQYGQLDDAVDALREAGVTVVGTDVTGGEPFDQGVLDRPVAIVMGSEPHGLDRDVDLDAWAHIAMPGRTESLNVAMAGTLLLHEASRS